MRALRTALMMGLLAFLPASAQAITPQQVLGELDPSDPLYDTPSCVDGRNIAMQYDNKGMLRGAVDVATFLAGPLSTAVYAGIDKGHLDTRAAIVEEIRRRCISEYGTARYLALADFRDCEKAGGEVVCTTAPAPADGPRRVAAHSMLSFGAPRVPVFLNGQKFMVSIHKSDDAIMMQGAGNGAGSFDTPIQVWRRVAEAFVTPVGCEIPSVTAITKNGGTWEASFTCPDGVNLHTMITAQKTRLKKGLPFLRPDEAG